MHDDLPPPTSECVLQRCHWQGVRNQDSNRRPGWHDNCLLYGLSFGSTEMYAANRNLRRLAGIARRLIVLAEEGEAHSCDCSCLALYGVARDCGYRIKDLADQEWKKHQTRMGTAKKGGEE